MAVRIPSLVTSNASLMFSVPPVIVTEFAVRFPSLSTLNSACPPFMLMEPELTVISPATFTVPADNSLAIAALSAVIIFATS